MYLEYPIDNRIIFEMKIPEEKILRFKNLLHSNLPYYSNNSIRHPAKMNISLTRWILQRYTKKGETVIDPMAGIGTTLIEAISMGRNCIAVEFEKKFINWTDENIILLKKNRSITKRGQSILLSGDARDLMNILDKQADKIIFSPPYCGSEAFQDQDFVLRSTKVNPTSRKISEQNYGKADIVMTSPPHANALSSNKKEFDRIKKLVEKGKASKELTRKYNDWLKNKNKNQGCQGHWESSYSKNKENIGNLPKGNIDTVITSPPFSQANRGGGIAKKGYDGKHGKDENLHLRHERQLTRNKNNISNLPHGDIDVIVTSPPYAKSPRAGNRDKDEFWDKQEKRHDRKFTKHGSRKILDSMHYSDNFDNIGNLSRGDIDVVITSPPYENLAHKSGNIEQHREIMKKLYPNHVGPNSMRNATEYSENKNNIGNLTKKTYLSEMKKVYEQCYSVIKPDGFAILVTKNFVRNWTMVRLDMDTILLMESCGFKLIDRYFRAIEKPSFWIINYRKQCKKKGVPDPTAHYEDILVFKKEAR